MSNAHPPRSPSGVDYEARDAAGLQAPPGDHYQQQNIPPADTGSTKIYRSKSDKVVGGVCGGLGHAVGVDPVWFRLGFIFLALSSGIGLVLYLIAWIIVPETPEGLVVTPRTSSNSAVAFGIFLLAVGSALFIDALIPWFDRVVWPVAIIGLGIGLVYFGNTRRRS